MISQRTGEAIIIGIVILINIWLWSGDTHTGRYQVDVNESKYEYHR